MILVPSCSEMAEHLRLTEEEILFVRKLMSKLQMREKDHILEHFGYSDYQPNDDRLNDVCGNVQHYGVEGVAWLCEGITYNYNFLKDMVDRLRSGEPKEEVEFDSVFEYIKSKADKEYTETYGFRE